MICAFATTGRSPMSSPSLLTKSFLPPWHAEPHPTRPKPPDVPLCAEDGLSVLDGSRPSDLESTSDNVPCQLFDIRLVPVTVTPLYRLYSPGRFVIWNTL